MILVDIRCSGFGQSYDETVEVTKEEVEQCAIEKLRKTDASERMMVINTSVSLSVV